MVRITPLLDRSARAGDGRPRARAEPSTRRRAHRPRVAVGRQAALRDGGRPAPPRRRAIASASVPDDDDLDARARRRRSRRAARGHDRPREPSRAASRRRRSSPPTARSSPSSPTSPMATVPGTSGRSRSDEARARASGRSRPGSSTRQAAGQVRVDVVAGRGRSRPAGRAPRPAARAGSGRRPTRSGAARAPPVGATSAWTSTSSGRRPLERSARPRCPAPARRARRGTRAPGRRPRPGPRSPISNTPTSSVDPYRFFVARSRRRPPVRSPSTESTTSTRCSSVLGPASVPSLVTWPDEDDRHAVAPSRAPSAAAPPRAPGRRCPAARRAPPRRPSAPSRRRAAPGRSARASSDDPPDARLGHDADRVADRPARQARGAPPAAGPGAATPRRSRRARAARRPRRAPPGRDLEQQRRLADAGLAAEQHDGAGDQPAAQHAVQLADPDRAPDLVGRVSALRRARPARTAAPGTATGAGRGSSRTTVSTRVFHSPHGAALALPAQDGGAAGLADEPALGAGHGRRLGAAVRLRPGSSPRWPRSIEALAVGIEVHDDRVARLVPAQQQVLGERVLDQVLDRPAQRPGAVGLVVAELDEVLLGRLGDLEVHPLGLELVADPLEHQVDDLA